MSKRILYIITRFPSVSHTFIYREIEVLYRAGYKINTVSMGRPHKNTISHEALKLYESTVYLDQIGLTKKLFAQLLILTSKPCEYFRSLFLALREKEVKNLRDRVRMLYHFFEAGFLYIRFKDKRLNHIHAHFLAGPTSIALFLSRYLKIPFSFTMHGSLIYLDPIMLKTKLQMSNKAVTISEYNKKYLISKYGKDLTKKIYVIHCGIDLQAFKPGDEKKSSPPVILAVGRLIEIKGFRYLLEAFRILRDKEKNFKGYIVGDGEEMNVLREKVKEYGIDRMVYLLGKQPQERVRELLQEASIFTLPSIVTNSGGREGIPVSLMEAMAMQLPVVSTKTVGIPELIENGKEGILVEQRNAEELSSALEFLLKDPEAGKQMGIRGRNKIYRDFNLEHIPHAFKPIFK